MNNLPLEKYPLWTGADGQHYKHWEIVNINSHFIIFRKVPKSNKDLFYYESKPDIKFNYIASEILCRLDFQPFLDLPLLHTVFIAGVEYILFLVTVKVKKFRSILQQFHI